MSRAPDPTEDILEVLYATTKKIPGTPGHDINEAAFDHLLLMIYEASAFVGDD